MNSRLLAAACPVALAVAAVFVPAGAEPESGDVFREYKWIAQAEWDTPGKEGTDWITESFTDGSSGRVGGQLDNMGRDHPLPDMDLEGATKAEAVVEKVQCHDGTYGIAISLNGNPKHTFPEPDSIAKPLAQYQHHIFPEVSFEPSELKASGNTFKLTVGGGTWWAQNLVYGVIVRVYYDDSKPHVVGRITSPTAGSTVMLDPELTIHVPDTVDVNRVEYIGYYEDYNFKGDGTYRQWQYRWFRGWMKNNLGTSKEWPFTVTWENEWVPEQTKPMRFAARIVEEWSQVIYMTEPVEDLKLARSGLLVEMCRPYNIPQVWVTRSGAKSEKFKVEGDLTKAIAARVGVTVWQYEFEPTVQINGTGVGTMTTPSGLYNVMDIPTTPFKAGENTLTVPGGGHHGCEINWPGVVPFIQYEGPEVS